MNVGQGGKGKHEGRLSQSSAERQEVSTTRGQCALTAQFESGPVCVGKPGPSCKYFKCKLAVLHNCTDPLSLAFGG